MNCNKNIDIKQATTPLIKIPHTLDLSLVKRVDFLFKNERSEEAEAILLKQWPGEVTEDEGTFYIPLTYSQTRLFPNASDIYLDPRIVYETGESKRTGIVIIWVDDTLWSIQDVINAEGGGDPSDYTIVVLDRDEYEAIPVEDRDPNTLYFLKG